VNHVNVNHMDDSRLALLAGGDLGFWRSLRAHWHVRGCERCRAALEAFQADRRAVAQAAQDMPASIDWARLSEEMTGNIRVGLAAGECVGDYPAKLRFFRFRWSAATVVAVLTAVFVVGFWINLPAPQADHLAAALKSIVSRSTAHDTSRADMLVASGHGIEAKTNGASLSYVPPDPGAALVTVSTRGSVAARSLDDDTGQTTITEVYDAR
jgi:hypothetical protein